MQVRRIPLLILILLSAVNVLIWHAVFATAKQELTVAYLQVGQGDATFIETPDGAQMLIDGGEGERVLRELAEYMPPFDRSIDVILATHPDADHIGGLIAVMQRYEVSHVIGPGVSNDTSTYTAFRNAVAASGAVHTVARRGMRVQLNDRAHFFIHFPDRDLTSVDTNATSIIGRLVYGESSFLFTGDAPDAIERTLAMTDQRTLAADVLKVGHHGSDTSTTDIFLAAVTPQYAVISAGADNRHGHPHKEVLEQLADFNIQTLGTYKDGAVVFESDGETVDVIY
jgi:competence protein ComEC